jgi:hypothetical protein
MNVKEVRSRELTHTQRERERERERDRQTDRHTDTHTVAAILKQPPSCMYRNVGREEDTCM